jgi:LysM repeat protein
MSHRIRSLARAVRAARLGAIGALTSAAIGPALAVDYPVTPAQRGTAQQVAQAGVPLSELAANAPDSHTVKTGDTLWDISKLFLRSPWRWPELWGMNLEQIKNPHLIYPGQVLYLDKSGGRARLRMGQPVGVAGNTVKLSPRVRSAPLDDNGIPSIPLHLIQPFLSEAVVFETDELQTAPRIVATQEGRVLVSRGDVAYVRGDLGANREYRVFRSARPLLDPTTKEVLGYEAAYLGAAEYVRPGETRTNAAGKPELVPATFSVTGIRQEIGVGDRLAPVPARDYMNYTPHAPNGDISGQIVSIYGDGLNAGQNQIVALNRGSRDGVERGHVLALWRAGQDAIDTTDGKRTPIRLPDERHGMLFVFSVFDRVSYALILSVLDPVKAGDRFTQP